MNTNRNQKSYALDVDRLNDKTVIVSKIGNGPWTREENIPSYVVLRITRLVGSDIKKYHIDKSGRLILGHSFDSLISPRD